MEMDGLLRCMKMLKENEITIKSLTTDRHPTVESHMAKNVPEVEHRFDTWHVVKS